MEVVSVKSNTLPVPSPKESWEGDAHVVHYGRTDGDVEQERQVMERIQSLGLMQHKIHVERQLMNRLETLMSTKDDMYGILNRCRRKRPLKARLNATMSEIRKLIQPTVIRDSMGHKISYNVNILMGFFTKNVRYHVDDQCQFLVLYGETPDENDKLSKEVTLEFPHDVDMSCLQAEYAAGVFKISVPFQHGIKSLDEQSLLSSGSTEIETDSNPSMDCQSVTSSDDIGDSTVFPDSDASEI